MYLIFAYHIMVSYQNILGLPLSLETYFKFTSLIHKLTFFFKNTLLIQQIHTLKKKKFKTRVQTHNKH